MIKFEKNVEDIIIQTVQGDNYTPGCLLDYPYFKEHYS